MALSNEPKPPVFCEDHDAFDVVDLTNFGQTPGSGIVCIFCGGNPNLSADVLYEQALAEYEERKREYDRLTPVIERIERELRGAA